MKFRIYSKSICVKTVLGELKAINKNKRALENGQNVHTHQGVFYEAEFEIAMIHSDRSLA
jgi:hypothetical protein